MNAPVLRFSIILILLAALLLPAASVVGQEGESVAAQGTDRPLVVIKSYYLNKDSIRPNDSFNLYLSIQNDGALDAHNLIFSFSSEDFLPMETGGVIAVGSLAGGGTQKTITQPMLASAGLWGSTSGRIAVTLSYNGPGGEAYSETFTITLQVLGWSGVVSTPTPTPTVTPTGTAAPRAQLVVPGYQANVLKLQPGTIFTLDLEILNLGGAEAQDVTLIIGGGSFNSSGGETPVPGGVSGGSADLSVFAPIGSSNLQFLGDIQPGKKMTASHDLIVNVSANPGAYTLKISFIYLDQKGNRQVDDQIITLLVYQLPQLEVNFYRDPGPIFAMAPNTLPIQVFNLGRRTAVMGNMTVSAENADLMNNTSLVGTLEPGGYFPLDVMLIPQAAGPIDIKVTIYYTDDFNQQNVIELVIPIVVQEETGGFDPGGPGGFVGPGMGPDDGGYGEAPVVQETFWQKVVRFFKGLFGLDSAPPGNNNEQPYPGEMPPDGVPLPSGPGGKG
jgi:hypothetical protein